MIKIDRFEISKEKNGVTLYFKYLGESPRDIKIFAIDSIFETVDVWIKTSVEPDGNYWAFLNFSVHIGNYLNGGFKFLFLNANEGEEEFEVHKEYIQFITTDFEKRSLGDSYPKGDKNFWIIGDSNVGFLFKDLEDKDLYQSGYVINGVSHLLLSLNRFLKSDYLSFLKTLPIRDGDVISFFLGEIDLRVSILRNSDLKSTNPRIVLDQILENYMNALHTIKEKYPNCEIIVLRTNPPIKDGVIGDQVLIYGRETERMYLYLHFDNFFRNQNDFKYWDCHSVYAEENGFVKREYLTSSTNQHIKDGVPFLEDLKKRITDETV